MEIKGIKEILSLIKAKKAQGFELLYQHYFRFLFSVSYSVLNNEQDTYDVIQSVMMRLYVMDESLFPSDHELGWLKTVARNEALMKLRKEKPTVPLEDAFDLPVQDQKIEDFVDMEQFSVLTSSLNERQRKVVTMKIMGDMTHREIAKLLSLPIGTVQWLYATSIKELRRAMSALTALVLACGVGAAYQLTRYFTPGEAPGEVGVSSIPEPPVVSPWLPVSIVLFAVAATALILFFKFSDRLPTKRLTKRI